MSAPGFIWAIQNATFNTNQDDSHPRIVVNSIGETFMAYQTKGSSGGTNEGDFDICIKKFGPDGNIFASLQTSSFNTSLPDSRPAIALDPTQSFIYIAYMTDGAVPGETSSGISDIVVAKFDVSLALQWVVQEGGPSGFNTANMDTMPDIGVDTAGNAYVTFATLGASNVETSSGQYDVVVMKISSTGVVGWVRQNSTNNTSGNDISPSISVEPMGNMYVAYTTDGTITGETGAGDRDIVVFKLEPANGLTQWVKQAASFNSDYLDVDPRIAHDGFGNVILTYYRESATPGQLLINIAKLNGGNGDTIWNVESSSWNTSIAQKSPDLIIDSDRNIYIAHTTDTGPGGFVPAVFSISEAGNFRWRVQNPAFATVGSGNDQYPSIGRDNQGNLYVSYYAQNSDYIPGGDNTLSGDNNVLFKLGGSGGGGGGSTGTVMIPAMVNPYLAIGSTFYIYKKEAIDVLVAEGASATLPGPTSRVSWAPSGVVAYSLLKDLKRSAVVPVSYSNPLHAYVFRAVQLVSGLGSEGVSGNLFQEDPYQTGYICVWSASGLAPVFT